MKASAQPHGDAARITKFATHKWEVEDGVFISFSTGGPVPDSVWNEFVNDLSTKKYSKYLGAVIGIIELTSVQRKNAAAPLKGIPASVVTDERLVRGLVTAVSWLGLSIKAFAWAELGEAVSFLNLAPVHAEQVRERVLVMRNKFGSVAR